MARRSSYHRDAYRALARIEENALDRCELIGRYIVEHIKLHGPYDDREGRPSHQGTHLKDSYYYRVEGDSVVIKSTRRYWVYVEFGTNRPDIPKSDARPHVRPALDAAKAEFRL